MLFKRKIYNKFLAWKQEANGQKATLWWMRKIDYQPKRDVTMVVFRMEESSWFGKAYVGSLAMAGQQIGRASCRERV